MTKPLLIFGSLALVAALLFLTATQAVARGGPATSSVDCEDFGSVVVCYADTRASCQQSIANQVRTYGPRSLVTRHCEQIFDGRWIYLLWP